MQRQSGINLLRKPAKDLPHRILHIIHNGISQVRICASELSQVNCGRQGTKGTISTIAGQDQLALDQARIVAVQDYTSIGPACNHIDHESAALVYTLADNRSITDEKNCPDRLQADRFYSSHAAPAYAAGGPRSLDPSDNSIPFSWIALQAAFEGGLHGVSFKNHQCKVHLYRSEHIVRRIPVGIFSWRPLYHNLPGGNNLSVVVI